MLIHEDTRHGKTILSFELTAADPGWSIGRREFGPLTLRTNPGQYVEELFKRVDQLTSHEDKEQELGYIGADLFKQLVPPELGELLWSMRHRATTLLVQSEEPWIPWELIRLQHTDDKGRRSGPFLCEAFAMTRWLDGSPPYLHLPLRKMAIVVPESSDLKAAHTEYEYLKSREEPGREIHRIAARSQTVEQALASGEYDGWHFSSHGRAADGDPNLAGIPLDDYRVARPKMLSGEAANLGRKRPLVFLNGCHTGRSDFSLTRMGGWSKQFLDAGAGAFIGAYWAIDDDPALAFAKVFYEQLFADVPIAAAVQQARRALRCPGDVTRLAYTVYAHPLASCREIKR